MTDLISRIAALPREQRDAIFRKVKREKDSQTRHHPAKTIKLDRGQGPFPLSFAQESLWIYDQMEPGGFRYNVPVAVRITGSLNISALEQGLTEIARRHETWRTTFSSEGGRPFQQIAPFLLVTIPAIDLSGISSSEREKVAAGLAIDHGKRPFDLSRLPIFRPLLIWQCAENEDHILTLTSHHIISDRWSCSLVVEELIAHYDAFSGGVASGLPEPVFQYRDYALWQRELLSQKNLESHLSYWREQLAGSLPVLDLPTDRPRPAIQSYKGGSKRLRLLPDLVEQLEILRHEERASLFMVMLAAFTTLLFRYTGQDDIVVGVPIANRTRPEIEKVIGFFVNTLLIRTRLSPHSTFRELLRRVREVTLDAYAHQDLPFEKLVQDLQPGRDPSRNPLFQVCMAFQNIGIPPLEMRDARLQLLDNEWGISRLDLSLFIWETLTSESQGGGLTTHYSFNADLWNHATIDRMAGHYQAVLETILADPDNRIAALPFLTRPERHQLRLEWNSVMVETPREACMHELFESQVEATPDRVAVIFEDDHLSYHGLNRRSNQLGHMLQRIGVGPEDVAGIFLERSVEMIVGVLGIMKAGGAYLPLDPRYPKDRASFMLKDAGVRVLVSKSELLGQMPAEDTYWTVCLDRDREQIAAEREQNPRSNARDRNLAYIIYTSGSTGKPKGVMIEHRSFVNLSVAFDRAVYAGRGKPLRVSMNAPLVFDASVKQWMQLLGGHTVCVIPEEVRADGAELASYLDRLDIQVLDTTPAQLKGVLAAGVTARAGVPQMVFVAGEAIDELTWENLRRDKRTDYYNLYGPTECTDDTTYQLINGRPGRPTIGAQIGNIELHITEKETSLVPIGVAGELHIGGASPGRGYLNRQEATAERYVPSPHGRSAGGRLYKTGDIVRRLPDGNIEFVGRKDRQVKIRGYRIELGEVEAALREHAGVRDAVVIAEEDHTRGKRLVGYIVDNEEITGKELLDYLGKRLPEHMIPSALVKLDEIPLTHNKKVDYAALPASSHAGPLIKETYVAPQDNVERELAAIWEGVLGVKPIGVHDNFFRLGGHSLLAIQMMMKVRQRFDIKLIASAVLGAPTIASLAALIRGRYTPVDSPVLAPLKADGERALLFCVHPAGGQVMIYKHLADSLSPAQPVYGVQSRALMNPLIEFESFDTMALEYARAIREQQTEGPYYLAGWSIGGVIAVSIARELEHQGQIAAFVGLIDSYLFEDDPFTIETDPLLGLGLAFGGALSNAFNMLDTSSQRAFREELLLLPSEQRTRRVIEWGQAQELLPAELSPEALQDQISLAEIHDRLFRSHQAPIVQAPLHVWWARDRSNKALKRTDWTKYTNGTVQVEVIEGNHFSIVRSPHCDLLSVSLQTALDRAMASREQRVAVN